MYCYPRYNELIINCNEVSLDDPLPTNATEIIVTRVRVYVYERMYFGRGYFENLSLKNTLRGDTILRCFFSMINHIEFLILM